MGRRAAVVAAVVVGAAAVLVLRARDDGPGVLDVADVESATVALHTMALPGWLRHEPVAVGDVLVSYAEPPEPPPPIDYRVSDVVYSTDLGATWARAELPGLPPIESEVTPVMTDPVLHRLDDAVAVESAYISEVSDEAALYLWVTTNGIEWRGGVLNMLDFDERSLGVAEFWGDEEGRLYATVWDGSSDVTRFVVGSDDDGATWEETGCPPPTAPSSQPTRGCSHIQRSGDLLVSPDNGAVSLDDGRTWVEPELPGIDSIDDFEPVERSDGGWLAVATVAKNMNDCEKCARQMFLLRSDDGLHWERVFYHDTRCSDAGHGELISTPVPLGQRWAVAYNCLHPTEEASDGPLLSQLFVLSADGRRITPVADTVESDYRYGQPVVVGDTVAVALYHENSSHLTNVCALPGGVSDPSSVPHGLQPREAEVRGRSVAGSQRVDPHSHHTQMRQAPFAILGRSVSK